MFPLKNLARKGLKYQLLFKQFIIIWIDWMPAQDFECGNEVFGLATLEPLLYIYYVLVWGFLASIHWLVLLWSQWVDSLILCLKEIFIPSVALHIHVYIIIYDIYAHVGVVP